MSHWSCKRNYRVQSQKIQAGVYIPAIQLHSTYLTFDPGHSLSLPHRLQSMPAPPLEQIHYIRISINNKKAVFLHECILKNTRIHSYM